MTGIDMTPRALLSLLFNGPRALDVVETAYELGLLHAMDEGTPDLAELAERFGLQPSRLYKFLDCLESLGLVRRDQPGDDIFTARYGLAEGVREAAEAVLGPCSQERDREKFDWRALHGRLPQVLRGEHGMPPESFEWPLRTDEQIEAFERSMTAGLPPIVESFRHHATRLFAERRRVLDVGGGDGTLASALLEQHPHIQVDVYNLPATKRLVDAVRDRQGLGERLGFVGGDFLREPLPCGYDDLLFVRVLHDWPAETARALLDKAHHALGAGGRVVICEELRTPERLAAQFFWTYFLIGVDSCVSRLREADVYRRMLCETGFDGVEVLDGGPFELIVAQRGR